ncbi:hypothetical protein GQX74_014764 [Glossina fuscipes]|nr:hypothetical protein GQX74_014764 [Glossina fuscipes]
MQACRLHFIKAQKWSHDSESIVRTFGGEKAVKDDRKSCNNNGDEDLSAYFEMIDKLLSNDNCNNNDSDHDASNCTCCDLSDSMASEKEEGKCKKPEEGLYRKEVFRKDEYGVSVAESRIVHSESRHMAGMQSCAQIPTIREINQSEEISEVREDSICSFNETQESAVLGYDKKQKKSVSKKNSASRLALEKKRLEVEHQRLELEKKKFEWQQEKEGCELKLKQTELERLFELKKCELDKQERIEKEKMKLQLEHEARLKKYEVDMKSRQNRSSSSTKVGSISSMAQRLGNQPRTGPFRFLSSMLFGSVSTRSPNSQCLRKRVTRIMSSFSRRIRGSSSTADEKQKKEIENLQNIYLKIKRRVKDITDTNISDSDVNAALYNLRIFYNIVY